VSGNREALRRVAGGFHNPRVVSSRFALVAISVALVLALSGLARAAVVLQGDCCEDCDESDCPDEESDSGCPLPCSDCVCAVHVAPIALAHVSIELGTSGQPAPAVSAAEVHPEVRFLPGVFRPPRPLS
jgi:hypothetical protein